MFYVFQEQDTQRLTRQSASDSQVLRGDGRRATITSSSSSNEEYCDVNDSTEKLIPRKLGSQRQCAPQPCKKDTVSCIKCVCVCVFFYFYFIFLQQLLVSRVLCGIAIASPCSLSYYYYLFNY